MIPKGSFQTLPFCDSVRANTSKGPGSKQQSRFHPFDVQNITRSKWSGRDGGEVSSLLEAVLFNSL